MAAHLENVSEIANYVSHVTKTREANALTSHVVSTSVHTRWEESSQVS